MPLNFSYKAFFSVNHSIYYCIMSTSAKIEWLIQFLKNLMLKQEVNYFAVY